MQFYAEPIINISECCCNKSLRKFYSDFRLVFTQHIEFMSLDFTYFMLRLCFPFLRRASQILLVSADGPPGVGSLTFSVG